MPPALSLVLALALVTLGAQLLVRGASALALRAGVSSLFVGLTIVGIGTSMPELGASLFAAARGSSDVAVGNVVGSNLFNIGVILGLTALVHPIRVELRAVRRDLLFALAVACVPFAALAFGGELPRGVGAVFLALFTGYVILAFQAGRRAHADQERRASDEITSTLAIPSARRWLDATWVHASFVVAGLACLVLGSRSFVDSAITMASTWGISQQVIGLTIVSAGTSLPELVTSVVAARRGNADIAVGNVIGSNIFNILGVLGVCSVARPQGVPPALLAVDIPLMIVATLCLLPIVRSAGTISRTEGAILIGGYAAYLAWLFAR